MNPVPDFQSRLVNISPVIAGENRTCLVYHINEGLYVNSRKAMDYFILIVA